MEDRGTKRDLVLAPSEYAYMQDVTKGIIKTYTGPTVINPTAQERPVTFDPVVKRFTPCGLDEAVQQIAIAPEGYYLVLKNPSEKGEHPASGGVYPSPDLEVGRKINITGPCSFALWPGQIVKLIQGHHLRSNQYLLVRVYNEDEARRNWSEAVIKPAADGVEGDPVSLDTTELTVGKQLIIKGTDVSFYIPPTGVGVVPEHDESYIREALTLERLEYCILVDENGKKRYERGPQVVFPEPTETFIHKNDKRKFRAIELNEIQGLHIKVIAPYEEGGRSFQEGDELFITGRDAAIFFPREEHSLVRYDGRSKHYAVAIPSGEARYVMNRKSGEIRMVTGPAMLLPNPVEEVIVRRILTDTECQTWYPGNAEALAYNRALRAIAEADPGARAGLVSEGEYQKRQKRSSRRATVPAAQAVAANEGASPETVAGDIVERSNTFTQPRTIVFNTKFEGVPALGVWVGYAVMVVDKRGNRRVEVGPKNLLLAYDETLEVLELSTGRPKSDDDLLRTSFLRVLNNRVGDACEVQTSDHVQVELEYSLRVNFTGEPTRWFEVENYVNLLSDHVRSVLKGQIRKHTIEQFYASSADVVRDVILGKASEGERPGMRFSENGMHVTDVEVLKVEINDPGIANMLKGAQHEAVESNISLLRANRSLEVTRQQEVIRRAEAEARAETVSRLSQLETQEREAKLQVILAAIHAELRQHQERLKANEAKVAASAVEHAGTLARSRAEAEQRQELERIDQELQLEALSAEVEAMVQRFGAAQGGFSEALLALSNHEVLVKVAEAMSVQQFIGGKTLTDVVDRIFEGTPLASVLERVKTNTPTALRAPDPDDLQG